MSLSPLIAILLWTFGPIAVLMIFYWIIRFAVRHEIEDAWRRRDHESPDSGYWDPARLGVGDGPTN